MKIVGMSVPVLTADIESAIARYGALLRTEVKARFAIPERGLTVAVLEGVTLIAGTEQNLAPLKQVRATFTVDSLAEFEAHVRATGGAIVQPATPTPAGRNMVVRDVEGAVFELVELRGVQGAKP